MYNQPPPQGHPAMMDIRARLRPMGIGDILDETFRLYRENFLLFIATVAVLEVPVQIINLVLVAVLPQPPQPAITPGQQFTTGQFTAYVNSLAGRSGATSIGALLSGLASVFIAAALAVVISNRYLNHTTTVGQAYRATLDRFGSLLLAIIWIVVRFFLFAIAVAIVAGVIIAITAALHIVALGIALAVIGGFVAVSAAIYCNVAWSLISQAIMLDGASGGGATGRSRRLVRGYWWKTLGLIVLLAILTAILSAIPASIVVAVVGAAPGAVGARVLVTSIVTLIISVLVTPISIGATTLLFYDLKIRKEAFDLETMARQAQAAAPPPYALS